MKIFCPRITAKTLNHSFFKAATCVALLATVVYGQTQNILTNGGFESGLMCYNTSIWNVANDAFASDYQFLISPDSHSGSNSIEIRCLTANCVKAAIASSMIQTPPSQAYKLSLYTKCPAGRYAVVYIPGVTGGYVLQPLACNGSWAANTVNFTSTSTGSDFRVSVYNYDVEWLRVDDMVLTYADGTVPQRPILHAGTRNVNVSGQHVNVDGQPYFALGFFDVPYADLGQVAALGANTIQGVQDSGSANCFNTAQESYLDLAYDYGLNFIPESSTTARLAMPSLFTNIAAQYSHHLANIGWFLDDEPDQSSVPAWFMQPAVLTAEYQVLAPQVGVPVMIDLQRASYSYTSEFQPYVGAADILMAEPYGPDFYGITHSVTSLNSITSKPIWLAQDAIDASLIVPKAYFAAVSGATGILYFVWPDFKAAPDKAAAVSQAFAELKQLSPAIFSSSILVTPPSGISAIGRTLNGAKYIIAVNPLTATNQGTFTVPGLPANVNVEVLFENRTLVSGPGVFQDTFAGIGRHVYRIAATVKQAPQITWSSPSGIAVGTALSAAQLNAQASVAGTFAYSPAAGTVLPVGTQTLTAIFTPLDPVSYTPASATVAIAVTSGGTGGTLPTGLSVTPSSGAVTPGTPQSFQLAWASPAGQTPLLNGNVLIQDSTAPAPTTGANACFLQVNVIGSGLLADDTGSFANSINVWMGNPWAASPANSQCTVNGTSSSLPIVGSTLQSTLSLTFNPSWAGKKLAVWLQGGNTNYKAGTWQQFGTITVAGTAPAPSPGFTLGATSATAIAGANGTSTVTVTPVNGFSSAVTLTSGWPSGITGTFGTNPATSSSTVAIAVGSGVAPGSYSLSVTGTSAALTASTTIALTVTAAPLVTGTLPGGVSVAPASGSVIAGTPRNFQVAWSSPAGQPAVLYGTILIQDSTAAAPITGGLFGNSCLIAVNTIGSGRLADDTGSPLNSLNIWMGNGWSISPANSHCSLNGPASTVPVVANAGTSLQATLNLTFNPSWAGKTLTIWLQGANSNYKSGAWQQFGTITVPGASPSFTLSATAAAAQVGASGASTITVNATNGFNSGVTLSTSSGWPAGITGAFGTNPATSSSTVTINVGAGVAAGSYSLPVTGISGSLTASAAISLTVTPTVSGGTLPTGVSVTPNTGAITAGIPQTVQLNWSSPAGQPLIQTGMLLIQDASAAAPSSTVVANACLVHVNSFSSGRLADDTGDTLNSPNIWFGNSWTVSPANSHCTVNGPVSSIPAVANAGASLASTLNMTFNPNWVGRTLTIWLQGTNVNYKTGAWQQFGTITVR